MLEISYIRPCSGTVSIDGVRIAKVGVLQLKSVKAIVRGDLWARIGTIHKVFRQLFCFSISKVC